MENISNLAETIVNVLSSKNLRISVVESVTGGLIGHTLTNVEGSSRILNYDLVLYSAEAKSYFLNIDMDFIHKEGTISLNTVKKIVEKMSSISDIASEINLAIVGVAGSEIEGQPQGTTFIAIECVGVNMITKELHFSGTREEIKIKATEAALKMILTIIE